jgi:CubicO group peptidase (beta-lactamase class C family)
MRISAAIPVVLFATVLGLAACSKPPPPQAAAPARTYPEVSPAVVGAVRDAAQGLVASGDAAGVVTLLVQDGRTLDRFATGVADTETRAVMKPDAIMAIASMTKPVTGVAMMMLYEQGLWQLDDPVSKFVPELARLTVLAADGRTREPLKSPQTMRQLMSHSAGFTYGAFGDSPADRLVRAANLTDPKSTLPKFIGKLAKLPLKHQPGSAWEYSVSVDVQGYIVEKLSGMPYDVYVREKILRPLKLTDTDFNVAPASRPRLAYQHIRRDGFLVPFFPEGTRESVGKAVPSLPSPGGALFSTAADYARFCQFIVNGGELDGVRLLKPETVQLMHTNMLPPGVTVNLGGPGTVFGLDFAIAPDNALSKEPWPEGTYYWSGIYGTFFWIDPRNHLTVVGMLQRAYQPDTDKTYDPIKARNVIGKALYGALN